MSISVTSTTSALSSPVAAEQINTKSPTPEVVGSLNGRDAKTVPTNSENPSLAQTIINNPADQKQATPAAAKKTLRRISRADQNLMKENAASGQIHKNRRLRTEEIPARVFRSTKQPEDASATDIINSTEGYFKSYGDGFLATAPVKPVAASAPAAPKELVVDPTSKEDDEDYTPKKSSQRPPFETIGDRVAARKRWPRVKALGSLIASPVTIPISAVLSTIKNIVNIVLLGSLLKKPFHTESNWKSMGWSVISIPLTPFKAINTLANNFLHVISPTTTMFETFQV